MAAKRILQSSINWSALAERVPEHQKSIYSSFKTKSDQYLRRMLANPESPPKIDWGFYKDKVPVAGMVDDFQKQYTALNIPYPPDTTTSQFATIEKDTKAEIDKFKKESNARIADYKKELEHLASLIPYSKMTMEEFRDAHPDQALDPIGKPTFWPHIPEEQPGYKEKDQPPAAH